MDLAAHIPEVQVISNPEHGGPTRHQTPYALTLPLSEGSRGELELGRGGHLLKEGRGGRQISHLNS